MKNLLLISNMLLVIGNMQSQSTKLDFESVYGLAVTFEERVFSDRCGCEINRKVIDSCHLYRISIDSVYFMLDSTVYNSNEEIKQIQYIMVTDQDKNIIQTGNTSFITCYNSSVKEYLMFSGIYSNDSIFNKSNRIMLHISGLIDCKQFNFFQKILLAFRINREKIYAKAPSLDKNKNSFWVYIDNQK